MKNLSTLCIAASTLLATSSAMAWESTDGAWSTSASLALSTEYVWRGITQSDSEPAISGSFDLGHSSGAYAGIWASNVDFAGSDASTEIDYYAGFANDIGDTGFSYDIAALYYDYPGASDENLDFTEVIGSVNYSFFTAGIAYTIDADNKDLEDSVYYSLDAGYDIGSISLAAGVGHYDYDENALLGLEDYNNYYVSASTEFAGFGLDLSYSDVDSDGELNGGDDQIVFTISKSM